MRLFRRPAPDIAPPPPAPAPEGMMQHLSNADAMLRFCNTSPWLELDATMQTITACNPKACALFACEDLVGRRLDQFIPAWVEHPHRTPTTKPGAMVKAASSDAGVFGPWTHSTAVDADGVNIPVVVTARRCYRNPKSGEVRWAGFVDRASNIAGERK